jgi:signal transduction histidine kinase
LVKEGSTNVQRGTDNEKGTGFGLIIVNEFINNNNGNLNIQSKVGEGTTFIIELPLNV